MWRRLLLAGQICLALILCSRVPADAVPPGFVEGHLKILSSKEVELAGGNPPKFIVENYADYPLVVLGKATQKEVARLTADQKGDFHLSLPPGDYILDVQGRTLRHLRAKPQPFTVVSGQTVRVDMDIDTGVR